MPCQHPRELRMRIVGGLLGCIARPVASAWACLQKAGLVAGPARRRGMPEEDTSSHIDAEREEVGGKRAHSPAGGSGMTCSVWGL